MGVNIMQSSMYTAELLLPEPSTPVVEMATEKPWRCKSPESNSSRTTSSRRQDIAFWDPHTYLE